LTGILGLFDPDGIDPRLVVSAAQAAAYRGRPEAVSNGVVAFAALMPDGAHCSAVVGKTADSLFVADMRIDQILGPPAEKLAKGPPATSLLDALLREAGPDALDSIAADFALARFDLRTRELTLARDAIGLRPLYWARRGRRVGFASDPEVLVRMGLETGEPDREALIEWLFGRGPVGDRTALTGIHRVERGHAIRFRANGAAAIQRWFKPERVLIDRELTLEAAAAEAREALVAAVVSRCEGRTVALTLSGGRDSSAVAAALAGAGIKATCITYVLQGEGVPSEAGIAREIARSFGHDHQEVSIAPHLAEGRMSEFARMARTPVQAVAIPIQLAICDAIRSIEAEVVLAGEGGDLLFMGFPITVYDLLREGRVGESIRAARNYHRLWTRSYAVTAKVGLRAISPRSILELRERFRSRPPWLVEPARPSVHPIRTDRMYLLDVLKNGLTGSAEVPERFFEHSGATLAWPLFDLRLVRLALRMPPLLRVPIPRPKPVLEAALLRGHTERLVKAPLGGFVRDLLLNTLSEFPNALGRAKLAADLGLVRREGLGGIGDLRWAWEAADLLGLEIWLRERERDG
jgi:asparagine synthetase B (glutamine-hydrolysing)